MLLLINTCVEKIIILAVKDGKKIFKKNSVVKDRQAEKIIFLLDGFLKKHNLGLNKISGIIVVIGPGKFSAVRAGVSIANSLGYGLNIPLASIKADEFKEIMEAFAIGEKRLNSNKKNSLAVPFYDKEPNIFISH